MPFIEYNGEVRPLGPGVLTVGGGPGAGWRILHRGLEGIHLLLSLEPGGRALLIRGSQTAQVSVNGVELSATRTLLSFGDTLAVGTATFRYVRQAGTGPQPSAYVRDVRRGRVYQLRDRNTIGRELTSTVVVHEPDVSRLHAELVRREDAYALVPHGVSVTSINGARVLAPTLLQEGDEIRIGRTLLRFTTAPPTGTPVSLESGDTAADPLGRDARAHTTFMGAIEAREQRERLVRRRLTRAAAVALVVIATGALAMALYADAHPPQPTRDPQSANRPARRGSRPVPVQGTSVARATAARPTPRPSRPTPQ